MTDHQGLTGGSAKIVGNKNSPASCELRGHADDRRYPVSDSQHIPEGFCQCGCGERTAPYTSTNTSKGIVKGRPARYIQGHNGRRRGPDYVEEDRGHGSPCWIWQRAVSAAGYGITTTETASAARAHRVYYEREYGPIEDGFVIDHLCGIRACVNPDHLEAVRNATNVRRGRSAKVDWRTVAYIRGSEKSNVEVAAEVGITASAVCHIRKGRRWSH